MAERAGITKYPWIGITLFCLAGALLRAIYLVQVTRTPIFPWLATDAEYFDAVARRILTGGLNHPDNIFLNPLYPFFMAGIYYLLNMQPLAVAIISGLLVQTPLVTMVMPLVYKTLAHIKPTDATIGSK